MRTFLQLLAAAAGLAGAGAAQQFVTNGDFSGGLTGWTEANANCGSGVQNFDVNGRGASSSYFCVPGGPANSIEQNVLMAQGPEYEFSCDVSVYHVANTFNQDAGTVYVHANGVEIVRLAFGQYAGNGEVKRARLVARFRANASGMLPLKLHFSRAFLCQQGRTPQHALDNVSLRFATGPTFGLTGNLKIGTTVAATTHGAPNAPFALFAAARELAAGLTVPGITNPLWLDPAGGLVLVLAATLDATGRWQANVPVPPDPALTVLPTFFQGLHVVSGSGVLGFHSGYVFVR
jgi:hypothetical protein